MQDGVLGVSLQVGTVGWGKDLTNRENCSDSDSMQDHLPVSEGKGSVLDKQCGRALKRTDSSATTPVPD